MKKHVNKTAPEVARKHASKKTPTVNKKDRSYYIEVPFTTAQTKEFATFCLSFNTNHGLKLTPENILSEAGKDLVSGNTHLMEWLKGTEIMHVKVTPQIAAYMRAKLGNAVTLPATIPYWQYEQFLNSTK